jgi:uncharacterized protein YrrD
VSADLGNPASYEVLEEGTPVFSCDGQEIGKVTHVLAAVEEDIFDGVVIDTRLGPGGHRFVDAPEVEEIFERGVLLKLDAKACESLHEPSENPASLEVEPDDLSEGGASYGLQQKLRRAWDLISGNY